MSKLRTDAVRDKVAHAALGHREEQIEARPYFLSRGGLVVVLNGFPGTGKLTIMRRLQGLLPNDTTCLLDNHLLIDPVVAVVPDRNNEHHELRRATREPIFQTLRKRALEGHIILMTACLAAGTKADAVFMEEHIDIVRGSDTPLLWVNVHCDSIVTEKRLQSQDRAMSSKTKLTDVEILRDIMRRNRLISPAQDLIGAPASIHVESMDVSGSIGDSVDRLCQMIGFDLGVEHEPNSS